jgi:C1A family cysteine protease
VLRTRAIAVAIASDGFQYYLNGTFVPTNSNINHGVTLVGYDPVNGFLIRNSWGNNWGTFGYAYVTQAAGVCDYAVAPIL